MRQEERRQQTTRLLLDTTRALIAEKGCRSVTMRDIMERSGLSKGAIFHYVKSKDELFVRLLQERLEETNRRFAEEVARGRGNFEEPMAAISESLFAFGNPQDVTNRVLLYLLGKEDDPVVADALRSYHERSVELSKVWIETGQRHGVIPAAVDAARTAELFVLTTLGLRVRASIPGLSSAFDAEQLSAFMTAILQGRNDER